MEPMERIEQLLGLMEAHDGRLEFFLHEATGERRLGLTVKKAGQRHDFSCPIQPGEELLGVLGMVQVQAELVVGISGLPAARPQRGPYGG